MNFKFSLILIIIISISIPLSVFILRDSSTNNDIQESEQAVKSFLYTAPEDQIISIDFIGEENKIRFEKSDNSWNIIENDRTFPVNPTRWSGITYLLKGPLIQRTLNEEKSKNLDQFGLKNPSLKVKLEFKGADPIMIDFGILSSDKSYQFVKLENQQSVHTLNASYGNALENLLMDPPKPEWIYDFDPKNIDEILIYKTGILYSAYGRDIFNSAENKWKICNLIIDEISGNPIIEKEPCEGDEDADLIIINKIIDLLKNPNILGALGLGLETEEEFSRYGITKNSTYIYLRNNTYTEKGTLLIKPITASFSDLENDEINAVFQDSDDVVLVEKQWAEDIKEVIR
tara:strand:+ start:231 stop:1265 length:1035 start_codon:yes stop_codon:yes gene_type:complete